MKLFYQIPLYWLYFDGVFATNSPNVEPTSPNQPIASGLRPRPLPHHIPGQPNGSDRHVKYHESCGVSIPSLYDWNNGKAREVRAWLREKYEAYFNDDKYDNFPQYMRDNFAPDVTPFALSCDGLNFCGIGNCMEISQNLTAHDRQMAYYVFESLSGIHATFHTMADSMKKATSGFQAKANELVEIFTYKHQEEHEIEKKEEARRLGQAIAVSLALVAMAIMGPISPAIAVVADTSIAALDLATSIVASVGNTYIAAQNIVGVVIHQKSFPVQTAELTYSRTMGWVSDIFDQRIMEETRNYTTGQLVGNINMELLIGSGLFVEPDVFRREEIHAVVTTSLFAASVNALWRETGDFPYILQTNAMNGDCTKDWRGPTPNRVCLPERPKSSFWLYFMVGEHSPHNSVKGPPGFRNFVDGSGLSYGITTEDIVRSSLWVHENHYEDKFQTFQPDFLDFIKLAHNKMDTTAHAGKVPGGFTLPICENPEGEAISAVWQALKGARHKSSTNFPCLCGPHSWKKTPLGTEEHKKFLLQTGFLFSRKYKKVCDTWNHCHSGRNHKHHWKWDLPSSEHRKPEIKHMMSKCRSNGHRSMGYIDGDVQKDGPFKA
ncbi:hypothetical protein BS50DRAFT_662391 [Corynespora cassiicola Philippines]|uniref:Uncharacterized protein n=1 Tax=Corynespora cassiicola Philippines TaxID=1448308 RepID=A0A2T2NXX2_CORCC|nr:hypothetical protein BS50DRAFT_662391 [Corynespora cassiicola Philippines]